MARGITRLAGGNDVALNMLAAIGKTYQMILGCPCLCHRGLAPVAKAALLIVSRLPKFLGFVPAAPVPDFPVMLRH